MAQLISSSVTALSSKRSSRTISGSNTRSMHLRRESDVTFVSSGDGISDYQQFLEKTSNPRDSSLLTTPLRTEGPPLCRREDSIMTSRFGTVRPEIQETRPVKSFEPIKTKRQRRKPHRVECAEDPYDYPGPIRLTLLTIGICLSVFLVSLDRTIVATVRWKSTLPIACDEC